MHVVFVSNCERKALPRTRSVLDRYAERIGDRAWATKITLDALEEVRSALKRQATRQTSVACYRNDAASGLRMAWIVGSQTSYDKEGRFAVATQSHKNRFPMFLRHAALVAKAAGLTHDFGKSSQKFQGKLSNSDAVQKDYIRHEWLSAWLLNRMLPQGCSPCSPEMDIASFEKAWKDLAHEIGSKPGDLQDAKLKSLVVAPNSIQRATDAVAWAVATHHGAVGGSINRANGCDSSRHIRDTPDATNVTFAGLGHDKADEKRWAEVFSEASTTFRRLGAIDRPAEYWDGIMLIARAAMILADHKISSAPFPGDQCEEVENKKFLLFANTKSKLIDAPRVRGKKPQKISQSRLDQPLSWHLQAVGDQAARNLRMFFDHDIPFVAHAVRDHVLSSRSLEPRFMWQDHAADHLAEQRGAQLIFNVASTGAGKTLANLKMALAMRKNTRLTVGFNLRSLTGQTFAAYRDRMTSLNASAFEENFACLMGSKGDDPTGQGGEDADGDQTVLGDTDELLDFDAQRIQAPDWLKDIARKKGESGAILANLVAAPVLVSTVDWIISAGEPGRQDRHAKAMIRLANSDLILDEVDSYDTGALVAVLRVIKISGMFGRNVIVSSATLNPVFGQAIVEAYRAGQKIHAVLCGANDWRVTFVSDLLPIESHSSPSGEAAAVLYQEHMLRMCKAIEKQPVTKRYRIAPIPDGTGFEKSIADWAGVLHGAHGRQYPGLKCRLSIGLIRVANVAPCMGISDYLLKDGRFKVCAYHARDLASRRRTKEGFLDRILNRKDDAWLSALIESAPWLADAEGDVCFVVVATPVEEVGRDHDFDWGIFEPSSIHSIIQAAGRVNRHRRAPLGDSEFNIAILDRNARSLGYMKRNTDPRAFIWPGFEILKDDGSSSHPSHAMSELLESENGQTSDILDARMLFDKGGLKTKFAYCDESAIKPRIEIAMAILRQDKGFECAHMIDQFAARFPLREGLRHTLILDWTAANGESFYTLERNKTGQTKPIRWTSLPSPRENVWLSWEQEEIRKLSGDSDIIEWSQSIPHTICVYWNGLTSFPA